ncbi:MAG: hypothetical protein COX57_06540 [Alphaproteobacteria bacterium CG_4_10_14_0_2_um_filter_63_37]|nr:MAG: hypothetical protein AUJ55_09175 [Proteobacteria bacterium CG1_02_64_396]PJA24813.1 MAG: hypothetical protein COX57_06540 [Alphaproteobacteria bacterium CG_4_10_14_0_2_um_filter_63_37]
MRSDFKKIAWWTAGGIFLVVLLAAGKVGLLHVPGITPLFAQPSTCTFCHETWYGPEEGAFNARAGAEKPFGVNIGCAECHPSAAEDFRSSRHGASTSALKPGCQNCHDQPHSVPNFFSHMFLQGGDWKGVQMALRDQDFNDHTLAPKLGMKERTRMAQEQAASCRSCHEQPQAVFPQGLPEHQAVLSGQGSCLDCHVNITHQRRHPIPLVANGDAARGEALAAKPHGPQGKTCTQCHGEGGISTNPEWPSLAGQGVRYLERRLRQLREAGVMAGTMGQVAMTLNDGHIDDLAAYFASLPARPSDPPTDPLTVARGKELFAACTGCHGPEGQGQGIFPRVAGQPMGYLVVNLGDYRDGARAPGSIMAQAVEGMSDEAIEQVAMWLATVDTR